MEALREGSAVSTARRKSKHCQREVQALREGSKSAATGKCKRCEREAQALRVGHGQRGEMQALREGSASADPTL
eukprot:2157829-Pyramimonas_sp.AAC.1